jgi:hypothetical protein
MIQTVETEIVKAHTRLNGVDARLKKIETKLDRVAWYAGIICGAAATISGQLVQWIGA